MSMNKKAAQTQVGAADLIADKDVQQVLAVIEGLINGTKKLVVETVHFNGVGEKTNAQLAIRTTHTFRVEDK